MCIRDRSLGSGCLCWAVFLHTTPGTGSCPAHILSIGRRLCSGDTVHCTMFHFTVGKLVWLLAPCRQKTLLFHLNKLSFVLCLTLGRVFINTTSTVNTACNRDTATAWWHSSSPRLLHTPKGTKSQSKKPWVCLFAYNIRTKKAADYSPQLDANRRRDVTEANRTLMKHMSAHMGPTAKISSFPSAPMQNAIQRLLGLAIDLNQLCTILEALACNTTVLLRPLYSRALENLLNF